jgi:hypothetical protein
MLFEESNMNTTSAGPLHAEIYTTEKNNWWLYNITISSIII